MLNIFLAESGEQKDQSALKDKKAIWFQLFCAEPQEIQAVEDALGIKMPTGQEVLDIETSSRLYVDNGTLYMTIVVMHSNSGPAKLIPVTFVLNNRFLVTNHSSEYVTFEQFTTRFQNEFKDWSKPELIFIGLIEAIVEKRAENLEKVGAGVDEVANDIFKTEKGYNSQTKLRTILASIGRNNDITTKERESLVTLERLLSFFSQQDVVDISKSKKMTSDVRSLQRDVEFMANHVSFLSDKINFLLDATLGYINIEQNSIIRIFSVAAVIFLPPTLIASIYGMNFKLMPELNWLFGYPFAIFLMILSALIAFFSFKKKGWL